MSQTIKERIKELRKWHDANDYRKHGFSFEQANKIAHKALDLLLSDEMEQMLSIIDKLQKTKDGVTIVPGMTVYCLAGHPIVTASAQSVARCKHDDCYDDWLGDKGPHRYRLSQCYSSLEASREALRAARHASTSEAK